MSIPRLLASGNTITWRHFEEVFGGALSSGRFLDPGAACVAMSPMLFFDREGVPPPHVSEAPLEAPNYLCLQVQVMPIVSDSLSQHPYVAVSVALGSSLAVSYFLPNLWILDGTRLLVSGNLQVGLAGAYTDVVAMRSSTNGNVFRRSPRYRLSRRQLHQCQRHARRAVELQRRVSASRQSKLHKFHKSTRCVPVRRRPRWRNGHTHRLGQSHRPQGGGILSLRTVMRA